MDIIILIILILIVLMFIKVTLKYMNKKISTNNDNEQSHEVDNSSATDKKQ